MTSGHSSAFPIPIVCPHCHASLALEHSCRCAERPVVGDHKGIPRLLFGQKYWGETSSAKMARILELTEKMHWEAALRSVLGTAPLYAHLTAPIRADFLHAMPWNRINTVLDVGAGMGFYALPELVAAISNAAAVGSGKTEELDRRTGTRELTLSSVDPNVSLSLSTEGYMRS